MTSHERKRTVTEALTKLAVATREKLERQTLQVYDEALIEWRTDTIVEACRRLANSSQWFPKVAEVHEACRTVTREREIREDQKRLSARQPDPVAPEKLEEFMAQIRALARRKSMPTAKRELALLRREERKNDRDEEIA